MYVLCTLAVLTLHSLLRKRLNSELDGTAEAAGKEEHLEDGGISKCRRRQGGAVMAEERRCGIENVSTSGRRVQTAQRSSALFSPAVMFGTRKTWDIGHAPCLQELWKKDISLDASSVDFLMSDGEDEGSFLSLPTATFSQRPSLNAELNNTNSSHHQLLIKTLQDKVCEFQAHLCSEEVSCHQLLQQTGGGAQTLLEEPLLATPNRGKLLQPTQHSDCFSRLEEEQLVLRLRTQVKELEENLLDQTQEAERLRSELGATDLEKQLERLLVENERLKQELKSCRSSEFQKLDAAAGSCSCSRCPRTQLLKVSPPPVSALQEVEALRREVSHWESQARQRELQLAEVGQELREKSCRVEAMQQQMDDSKRQLEDSRKRRADGEHNLHLRLQECEEELARRAATPPRVKFVTQTVEVESADSQKVLVEMQVKNGALQEQLSVQRQLLRELETQLHESQRTCTQLRTQAASNRKSRLDHKLSKIHVYEGEMQRAQGQLEAEMQNLEEEKNRVIEEAFIRAESEMKAVHENLAGVRMNLLSLQPALRTLTSDYNCLKKQVQDFPSMLDKAISEAKQEICQVISDVSSTNQELLRKYKREMNLRKKCHNELVRLKGNIRVFCRVRPVSQVEQDSADARTMLSFDSDDDAILYLSNKGKIMTFELDKVFPPQASQEEVFQEVQALVTSCIDGFNVCIFAYGQTGSGKTYTMEGIGDNPGINQRALRLLFSEVMEKAADWDYRIIVSMVEIYNETLRDLLRENPTDKLDIKMNPDGSGQLYVPGLTEIVVQSPEDINNVFELGHVNRATACTNLNEHSSRSHALLIISVSGFNSTTGTRTQGKLNLVDLAGSERIGKSGAEGSRLREAQCINKSLSALGDVISALRGRHAHIPFRNSRLTYLLQDSLSGDSKTLMMVQVSPLPDNMSESVCSLKFAQRVRSVELNSSSLSKRHENSSTSSSPTHDSVELDSPPVTPVPLPISRASSAGSTLSSASRTPSSSRRRSQSQLSAGRSCQRDGALPLSVCPSSSVSSFCALIGWFPDSQVDRAGPVVGDGGQDD
ncbi:kinesin-like protein KIFC3 isoform X2 [Girardinichthys multiradiatus]|uniref:kinesin-like protein KIFC3 isoform X2 n=1 Tax=Girardinichthys multiradiatus TaxID=208333 RepID=UPI001FAC8936|nr:kinesin-like protein KIFC3 isoform X2 [Girardinichthys multiradiatus]